MKIPIMILTLAIIFTWNAFASEKITSDTKLVMPTTQNRGPLAIEGVSDSHKILCKFESQRNPASLGNGAWNVIANGATFERRTITLFNSNLNKVVMMNCYKYISESPQKTSPASDSQVIEILKAAQVEII